MKKVLLFLSVFAMLFATACSSKYALGDGNEKVNFSNAKVVEEKDSYEIKQKDDYYGIFFLDEEKEVVDSFGPVNQMPETELINDSVLKINAVTNGVAWYYDLENNVKSETFMNVSAENGTLVAIIDEEMVIVQDMFDAEKVLEITEFGQELDMSTEPILSVEFNEDSSELIVTYLNEATEEVTENIAVNLE